MWAMSVIGFGICLVIVDQVLGGVSLSIINASDLKIYLVIIKIGSWVRKRI